MNENKVKRFTGMEKLVCKAYGQEAGKKITDDARKHFHVLCSEHADDPRALQQHTLQNMFPAIAFYRALQQHGIPQPEAFTFMYDSYAALAQPYADQMKSLLKIPGLYKLMPFMWKVVTKNTYGENAGFKFQFYPTGRDRVKFDMLQCPFCRVCEEEGCRELVPIFCHVDDINNEGVHPKLLWNRTKTLGGGDDCCDFDVIVLP